MSLGKETMVVSAKSSGAEYGAVPRSKERRLGDAFCSDNIVGRVIAERGVATEDNITEDPKSARRRCS